MDSLLGPSGAAVCSGDSFAPASAVKTCGFVSTLAEIDWTAKIRFTRPKKAERGGPIWVFRGGWGRSSYSSITRM